ncbi:glycosyltransferase [Chitinophaga lutea]
MRIAVHASALLQETPADTGTILTELFDRIVQLHPQAEWLLVASRPLPIRRSWPGNVRVAELKPLAGGRLGRYIWEKWQWPKALRKWKVDRVLSMEEVMPVVPGIPAHLLLARDASVPNSPAAQTFLPAYESVSLFSAFMRERVVNRFPSMASRIQGLTPGVPDAFRPMNWEEREAVKREFADGNEYFIAIGSLHPSNNIIPLLKAFSMFKKRLRSSMRLVLAGDLAPGGEDVAEQLKSYKFREEVLWIRDADEPTLARLVAGAYALVHTAGSDGLALPVFEALRCEVPAVALYAGATPEAGGDAALHALPEDVGDLAEKMGALYKDELLRSRLLTHAGHVPGWEDAARALGETVTA